MKRISLLTVFSLFSIFSFSDYTLTRGPLVGEIYYIGPTYTGLGIYHSLDYGNTAICVDSTTNATGIVADLTDGVLYYQNMGQGLYISYDYGQQGTWQLQSGSIYPGFASGRIEGEIYNIFVSHSDDFGYTFISHTYNGFFGNYFESEIDNQAGIGYVFTYKSDVADSVFLLTSFDNFDNLALNNIFEFHWSDAIELTRGTNNGELYLFNHSKGELWYSNDFAENWIIQDVFNFSNSFYSLGIIGGRQSGEVVIKYDFVNQMWQNAQTFFLHSTDNGVTFEVYNPFSKGGEPILANFSTINKEVHITTPVEFSNFSIGEIQQYEWDFDNNGIIDSYTELPSYVYQDTGWFSVKLTVTGLDSSNTFIKQNYIHILDTTTKITNNKSNIFSIYPNPIKDNLKISTTDSFNKTVISIYNLDGENIIKTYCNQKNPLTLNTSKLKVGVYILNIKNKDNSFNYKIIKN